MKKIIFLFFGLFSIAYGQTTLRQTNGAVQDKAIVIIDSLRLPTDTTAKNDGSFASKNGNTYIRYQGIWYVIGLPPQTGNANKYLTTNGTNPSWALINLTNGVTGNLPVANLNSGTSASSTTFWRGDGTWSAIPAPNLQSVLNSGSTANIGIVLTGSGGGNGYNLYNSSTTSTVGQMYRDNSDGGGRIALVDAAGNNNIFLNAANSTIKFGRTILSTRATGNFNLYVQDKEYTIADSSDIYPRVTTSSTGTLTLTISATKSQEWYIFTGSTTTWTAPAVSGNSGRTIYIKNRGSGAITLNSANTNEFYNTAATSSTTIAAGAVFVMRCDGTYWNF